ncbi:MAG: hypothetical protein D3923_00750 [Candidatus Electrothrix sp. AR3]|nr:hypothetical protein [Candidatus Electrothrix sp. AR3]
MIKEKNEFRHPSSAACPKDSFLASYIFAARNLLVFLTLSCRRSGMVILHYGMIFNSLLVLLLFWSDAGQQKPSFYSVTRFCNVVVYGLLRGLARNLFLTNLFFIRLD